MRVEESIEIDRPLEEALNYVSDVANYPELMADTLEVGKDTEGPPHRSDRFTLAIKPVGRRFETPYERTSFEANRRYTDRAVGGPVPDQRWDATFQEVTGGTHLTRAVEAEMSGILKLLEPIQKRAAERGIRRDLKTLKDVLEARQEQRAIAPDRSKHRHRCQFRRTPFPSTRLNGDGLDRSAPLACSQQQPMTREKNVIRLHDNLSSGNGYKVRLLLAHLGIPFERVEYDIDEAETRTPEFLENVNLNGRVPVLETEDGRFLPESNAILFYMSEGTAFIPDDRFGRAQILQWMFFEQYSHEPNIATLRFWTTHDIEMNEERRLSLETRRKLGYDALGVMEGHLRDRRYFVANRYSIADIALYAYTHVAHEGGFHLDGSPAIRAWLERVREQPGHIPITQG